MECALARRSPAKGPGTAALLVVLLISLLAGCIGTVRLVGDYDQVLDESVMQLQVETGQFFARIHPETVAVPPSEVLPFVAKAIGAVDAMAARAAVLEEGLKQTPLSDNLLSLQQQYEDLKVLNLGKLEIREGTRKAFNESFKALQVQLVYMKRAGSQRPE